MNDDDKTIHLVSSVEDQSENIKVDWNEFTSTLVVIDDRIGLIVDAYFEYISDDVLEIGVDADQMALGQELGRNFKSLLINHKLIIPEVLNWIENQLSELEFAYIMTSDEDMKIASYRLFLYIQYELLVGAYDEQEEQEETSTETETETSVEEPAQT